MENVFLTPMKKAILEIYNVAFSNNDIVVMIRTIYDDIPDRIFADDMTDEDYYNFGVFLMGVSTALLVTENDDVTRSYRQTCRDLRHKFTRIIQLIMHETDID